MQKKFNILILSLVALIVIVFIYWWQRGDALLVQLKSDFSDKQNNKLTEINNPDSSIIDESLSNDFDFTGSLEMHICNTQAICYRGNAVFEKGDVLTIVNTEGTEIEIDDSICDSESCLAEDIDGKEWDLVFITE